MAKPVPVGAHGAAEETVEFRHTVQAIHPDLPPVYSTPDMIRLMETATHHALQPYMEAGEVTVGTAINIEHRAPSFEGQRVRAEATLESSDGRFYVLRVIARAGELEIGRGTVTRAVIDMQRFLANPARKTAQKIP